MNMDKKEQFLKQLNLLFLKKSKQDNDTFLKKLFADVKIANSTDEALKIFNTQHIDLIIIEIGKRYKKEFKLINKIKNKKPFTFTFILSQKKDIKILEDALDLGINGFIKTPINKNKFIKKINSIEKSYTLDKEYMNDKENLNLLRQYHDITDGSTIISKTDSKGKIIYANSNFCKISGYSQKELIGQSHNIIRHPDTPKEVFKELWRTIKEKKTQWNGIIKNISKGRKSYYVKSTITPVLDQNGAIIEYLALRQNISSVLSDKQHFLDAIDENTLSVLILIQIDEFDILEKFYNLTTIDQIEKMFGYRILSYLPKTYKFSNVYNLDNGRYGLVADFNNFNQSKLNIDKYLEEFVNNVKKSTLEINEIEYDISISLSYAFGKHMLYEDAKMGLDEAIDKNIVVCHANDFSIRYQKEAKKNLEVIKMVKIALERYNIVSYFQPIIDNKTKEIEKYESLVRLIDEEGKVLSPYEFLHISKKGSYYNKITRRVLENSFKMLKNVTTKLSINLSTLDIEKDETRSLIYALLDEYKEDNNRLIFELLEDESVKDFQSIKNFIRKVKSQGVSIAIDDFGVGYSNFERLLEFEPDILKIDGSLIRNIIEDKYSKNIVETIVTFAKKQHIKTVAEYVETEEIFNYLNNLGVDYSQGYYFGRPEDLTLK
jgi:PAS domain S-box-containing protein